MSEPSRETDLRQLFDRAMALPASGRQQLLAEVADELLRERLAALLAQDSSPTAGALRNPLVGTMAPLRRIGDYELLRELGSGGMGVVVLARQIEPIERLVALKLVADKEAGPEIAQRFRAERQALALMNHPGIARIFDGGTTDDGAPYFVMEYVRGEPITSYCDRRRMGPTARVRLFVKVCDAVQHAHQKGVIHRDLKPGNVLVTDDGGTPQPKVIDFGVARAISGRLVTSAPTKVGEVIGTYLYMSPEQAAPSSQDIDTRADIYSLGVLLYELLVGQTPLQVGGDDGALLRFQNQLVTGAIPSAKATATAASPEVATQRALARGTTPATWQRYLASDIGWVLGRALELDRNHRYAAASDLAADLVRHLRGEAVVAGPPTWRYQAARFVRRHLVAVTAAAAVVLALLLGMLGALAGRNAALQARDVADAANASLAVTLSRQRAVGEFNEFVLFYGEPGLDAATPSLRQVLERLTPMIAVRWAGRQTEESAVHAAVGRAYLALGEPALALQQLQLSWTLTEATAEQDPAWATLLLHDLSRAAHLSREPAASRIHLKRMIELGTLALQTSAPELARELAAIAQALPNLAEQPAVVVMHCDRLLTLLAAMPKGDPDFPLGGRLLAKVGIALRSENCAGSDALLQRLEQIARRVLGADVDFLQVLVRFAENNLQMGQPGAALKLADEVLAAMQRTGLAGHWLQAQAERIRGLALVLTGELAAGEAMLLSLRLRVAPFASVGNEQVRAAHQALGEVCGRLASPELQAFLTTSWSGWLRMRSSDPSLPPWWPASIEDLPAAANEAALRAVEANPSEAEAPVAAAMRGALLLRAGKFAAAATCLESVRGNGIAPWPEWLADLAISRHQTGDATGASAAVAELRKLTGGDAAMQSRCQQAIRRVELAGLH